MRIEFTRQKLRSLAIAFIAAVGLSVYLYWSRNPDMPPGLAFLSLGVIWVGLSPTFYYMIDEKRPPMPFLPLVGIFYIISFGIPAFSYETIMNGESVKIDYKSAIVLFSGIFFYFTSYLFFKMVAFQNVNSIIFPRDYSITRLNVLLWIILFGKLTYSYVPIIRSIPSLGQFINPAVYLALGMFYMLWKKCLLSSWQKYFLILIFVPFEIIVRMATGALYQVMYLILFFGIIKNYFTKKIPIVLASVICVIYLLFNPVKIEYRYLVWGVEEENALTSVLNNSATFLSLAYENISNMKNFSEYFVSQEGSMARISHIFEFSSIVKDTPERVPFLDGETYKPLLTMFIPRVFWPNKPEENVGQSFGHRYGFLDPSDDGTSWNLPWITEMYANFGSAGVVLGMGIVGCIFAFLDAKFNRPEMTPLEFVMGTTVLLPLVFQESNFSLMAGGIFLLSVTIYLYFQFGLRA